ncbi:MAG: hypothetical protein ABI678_12820 [Kofleriaceae bacterium]
MTFLRVWLLVFLVAGCSERSNECHADSDCTNLAFPFCDVDGEYAAAGGVKNVCTITPPDCKPERCGCTPNATTCTDGSLSVCNADGRSTTETACVLGCAPDNSRCAMFAPSNGLADALAMAAAEQDVEFPSIAAVLDTGEIHEDQTGVQTHVKSLLVSQVGVPSIRVYVARSFKIHGALVIANVSSSHPIAFVASGPITIDGAFDAAIDANHTFGPGGQPSGAPCTGGVDGRGGGGGGNGTAGGRGAPAAVIPPAPGAEGGPAQPMAIFEPLVGGCFGGDGMDPNSGGAGGAGIQFVSLTSITVAAGGVVNVGGHGGGDDAGGGAGGTVLFEAPALTIDGKVTANGGSGGACGSNGSNATADATAAPRVGGCTSTNGVGAAYSGAGGTGTAAPGDGLADTGSPRGGGGGGAVGRVEVKTADGTYAHGASSIVSAKISAGMLAPK